MSMCPKCNCPRYILVRRFTWWNQEMELSRCELCGQQWRHYALTVPEPSGVTTQHGPDNPSNPNPPPRSTYQPLVRPLCPQCGGKTRCTSSRGAIRWHKCRTCGHHFKSIR